MLESSLVPSDSVARGDLLVSFVNGQLTFESTEHP